MSEYAPVITTVAGNMLITEAIQKKKPLVFTKIGIGDGLIDSESIELLTGLKHQILESPVTDKKLHKNGNVDIITTIDNTSVSTGFFARESGLCPKYVIADIYMSAMVRKNYLDIPMLAAMLRIPLQIKVLMRKSLRLHSVLAQVLMYKLS